MKNKFPRINDALFQDNVLEKEMLFTIGGSTRNTTIYNTNVGTTITKSTPGDSITVNDPLVKDTRDDTVIV